MAVPHTEIIVTQDGAEILRRTVPPGDYVLGRAAECDVVFEAELVSRRHAQLTIEEDQAFVQDLGSSHGTSVNGQPVTKITRLWPNQKIQVGSATVELRRVRIGSASDVSLAPVQAAVQRLLPEELLRDKKYDIGGVVAQGGMGAILNAREAAMDRTVAMKVMLDTSSVDNLARFVAEAKVTGSLEHPNIVPVHELSVDENGQPFYTMKMVRGITLKKVLELLSEGTAATVKKYPLSALLTVYQKLCDAVAFAHSKGIIHRDLKPENVMLGDFGEVLVMDWGLAKRMKDEGGRMKKSEPSAVGNENLSARSEASSSFIPHPSSFPSATLAGTVMGTPQYMSPEQARGEVEDLDVRSDIYALGTILYQILALRPAVTGRTAMEVVSKVAEGHVEPLVGTPRRGVQDEHGVPANSTLEGRRGAASLPHLPGGTIPDSLAAVVGKAMAFERDRRYRTVEELQADLTAYQTGFATSAENAGLGKQLRLALKRHKGIATSIAAALVVLFAVIAVAFVRVTDEKNRAERALADLQRTAPTLIAEGRKLIDAQQFEDALAKISFAVTIQPKNAEYRLLRAQLLQAMLRLDEAAAEFRHVLTLAPAVAIKDSAEANLVLGEKLLREYKTVEAFDQAAYEQVYELMDKEGRFTQALPITQKLGRNRNAAETLLKTRLVEWRKLPGWEQKAEKERVKWEGDGTLNLSLGRTKLADLATLQGLPVSKLELGSTPITNLSPLRGMHLRELQINGIKNLTDLSVLRGMPLHILNADFVYDLADISPLRGLPLTTLSLVGTQVTDFSALQGAPISDLGIGNGPVSSLESVPVLPVTRLRIWAAAVTDISLVRKMPLRSVFLDGHWGRPLSLRDFTPLLDCPALEDAFLPRNIKEIEVLKKHPGLRRAAFVETNLKPVAEFWAEFDAIWKAKADNAAVIGRVAAALAAVGLTEEDATRVNVSKLPDGTYHIMFDSLGAKLKKVPDLHGVPVSEITMLTCAVSNWSPLAGLPVRQLDLGSNPAKNFAVLRQCPQLEELRISGAQLHGLDELAGLKLKRLYVTNSPVTDIAAVHDMPLREFHLDHTQVSDFSPLAGLPLVVLRCNDTKVTDLRPLLSCPDLESLTVPEKASNIGDLRSLKKLKRLSYKWDSAFDGPAQTADEFWKEYDARHQDGPK